MIRSLHNSTGRNCHDASVYPDKADILLPTPLCREGLSGQQSAFSVQLPEKSVETQPLEPMVFF
jgi:hypothetical protein